MGYQERKMHSKNHITPFDGWEIQGMPVLTMVNGHIVAKDRNITGNPGVGKLVNPKQNW